MSGPERDRPMAGVSYSSSAAVGGGAHNQYLVGRGSRTRVTGVEASLALTVIKDRSFLPEGISQTSFWMSRVQV